MAWSLPLVTTLLMSWSRPGSFPPMGFLPWLSASIFHALRWLLRWMPVTWLPGLSANSAATGMPT